MDELKNDLFRRTYELCDKLTDMIRNNLDDSEEYFGLHQRFCELFDMLEANKLEREYFEYAKNASAA